MTVRAEHQRHRLQPSGWMDHQRVNGHISTGYEPKSSGPGGGVLIYVLMRIYVVYFCLGRLYFVWRFGTAIR